MSQASCKNVGYTDPREGTGGVTRSWSVEEVTGNETKASFPSGPQFVLYICLGRKLRGNLKTYNLLENQNFNNFIYIMQAPF